MPTVTSDIHRRYDTLCVQEIYTPQLCGKLQRGCLFLIFKFNQYCNSLSSDVTAGVDPTYKSVNEDNNSAFIGCGVAFCKYTGAHGKGSTSDANAEYVGKIRNIFNKAGVQWQICELGKVDQGGGGTVAQYIANLDVDTIDCGVPLLSMHAPFEIASKADVYSAYQGYLAFYKA